MAESQLRIPPSGKKPSFFNRSMAAGAGLGFIVGTGLVIPAILGAVGGYLGKKDLEQEQKEGRTVSSPGWFNKESIKDGLIGLGAGSLIGGLIAATILFIALPGIALPATAGAFGATAELAVLQGMTNTLLTAGIAALAATGLGGFLGLSHGKKRMEYEWKAAKEYVAANGEYKGKDQSPSIAQSMSQERYKDTVTPDEYRAMQEKMAAGKPRGENPAMQTGR